MKLELKTENENFSNSFLQVLRTLLRVALIIILCDMALKLKIISRHYETEFNCNLLYVAKSPSNFKKLSRLSNLKSKQKILEFCREVVK